MVKTQPRFGEAVLAWLYVPAPRAEELLGKAAALADGVVLDLEDAVHPDERAAARRHLAEVLPRERVGASVVVRVNPVGTLDFLADVAALTPLVREGHVGAIRVPKVETEVDVQQARRATTAWGADPRLICQLESARSILNASAIAGAKGVHSIMLGEADLRADLGLPRGEQGDAGLLLARQTCVVAARAAGLPSPVGSAHTDVGDDEGLVSTNRALRGLGFSGRSCVHPRQVPRVRSDFGPSDADLRWAQQVLEEARSQDGAGSAASVLDDGSFVDPAIVRQAERVLERSSGSAPEPAGHAR